MEVVDSTEVLLELARRLEETARPALAMFDDAILIDFPMTGNVGDSAIWLGMRKLLSRLRIPVRGVFTSSNFDLYAIRRLLGRRTVIVVNGGGNWGDLWPAHQQNREQLAAELRTAAVLQFPQSVCFLDPAREAASFKAIAAHPRFVMMARDRKSREVSLRYLPPERVLYCPDAAFFLGRLRLATKPQQPVCILVRADKERASPGTEPCGVDWTESTPAERQLVRLGRKLSKERLGVPAALRAFDAAAARRLRRGVRLLARGERAATDRLHGHILCCLLGKEHVVVDNSYGKVFACTEEWTGGLAFIRKASTWDEAMPLIASWSGTGATSESGDRAP